MSLQEIRLSDEIEWVNGLATLANKQYDSSTLIGPMVLLFNGPDCVIAGCTFDAPPDAVVLAVHQPHMVGLVEVRNVAFRNCRLRAIGLAVPAPAAAAVRATLTS